MEPLSKNQKTCWLPEPQVAAKDTSLVRWVETYIRWLNTIANTPLLILDDFGLQPLSQDMRLPLLQILEDRFAKGSTILTSQLPVNKWYEYINEPTLADAICDRLTANAHKIELKGESLRKKKNT